MPAPEPKPATDAPIPAFAAEIAAETDALDAVRLEVRVEELERRLRARSIELETELKAKERLRERLRELTSRVDELQETASVLHREAASSTSLARELDETLKVAAEARAQLGAALEAERARRLEAEAELSATESSLAVRASELEGLLTRLTDERAALLARATAAEERADLARKREEELAVARRNLAQLRQKNVGHEAHIESLRSDLEAAAASRARVEDESRRLQDAIEGLQKTFDARLAAEEEKARQAVSSAEQIRREGVEAFEKAREAQIRQDMDGERVQTELAAGMRRLAAESEQLKAKADALKQELRARADREVAEMRLALDEERARLYADIEVEREARGKRAAPVPAEDPAQRGRDIGEARRREIAQELEGYLAPPSKTQSTEPAPQPAPMAGVLPPRLFRWDEEIRLLLYVAISVSLVAAVVAGIVLYQG